MKQIEAEKSLPLEGVSCFISSDGNSRCYYLFWESLPIGGACRCIFFEIQGLIDMRLSNQAFHRPMTAPLESVCKDRDKREEVSSQVGRIWRSVQ